MSLDSTIPRQWGRWTRASRPPATINELCDRYEAWAAEHYQKPTRDGGRRRTREDDQQRLAIKALREAQVEDPETGQTLTIGQLPPAEMCAELLYVCQQWMVQRGLARQEINKRTHRLRRVMRWAADPPRRWIGPEMIADLSLVKPLKIGRTAAPEREPVTSAPPHLLTALQTHLAEQMQAEVAATDDRLKALELATMIDLHLHTGMRTHELAEMRRSELHEVDGWLVYQPGEHKTQHHGKVRQIFLGPIAQRITADWLRRLDANPETAGRDTLWRWTRGEVYRDQIERAFDVIYPPPSPLQRRQRQATGRKKGLRWESDREWRQRLGARWEELLAWRRTHRFTPGQLRHSFATLMERQGGKAGATAAQKLLGHSSLKTTQIYIDPTMQDALDLLRQVG